MVVLLFEKRFWDPLLSGQKVHSIRGTRKCPIRPGDELSLRGWSGAPYRSPQTVLRTETCVCVRSILMGHAGVLINGYDLISEPEELNAFARTDGFEDWDELKAYRSKYKSLDVDTFHGDFIQWGKNEFLETKKFDFVD